MSSALIPPHESIFGQDVAPHRFQEFFLRRASRQVERGVQRVELEEIAMGSTASRHRYTWSSPAVLTRLCLWLACAVGDS